MLQPNRAQPWLLRLFATSTDIGTSETVVGRGRRNAWSNPPGRRRNAHDRGGSGDSSCYIRGATDGWVPYPFLDPATGYGSVILYSVAILAAVLVVGAIVWALSRVRIIKP